MSHRRAARANAAAAVLAIAVGLPFGALAQDASSNLAGFNIRTESIKFNINTGDFRVPQFTATRQGTDITAERGNGNSKTKILHAQGHVIVHQNQQLADRGKATDLTQRPSTLTTDKLDVDGTSKIYTATGSMHFTQEGGRDATSDNAVLNDNTHKLHMEGHVHVKNGEQTIAADSLDYDTATGQVDGNGNVTITSPVESPRPGDGIARPKKRKLPI